MEQIRHCTQCGHAVEQRVPAEDNRPRAVCPQCGHIHYSNPKIVVGCLLTHGDKVLLCQRDIEPRNGYWTLPAGYMENGESTETGAAREAREEACAAAEGLRLFALYELPRINHVYLLYRGTLVDGRSEAGEETRAVALMARDEIPWSELAFDLMREALERHFEDPNGDSQAIHRASFHGRPGGPIHVERQEPR